MTPRRARVYVSLFVVLGASVAVNVLFLQPPGARRGQPAQDRLAARSQGPIDTAPRQTAAIQKAKPSDGFIREASATTVRAIQRELGQAGYYDGPVDGIANLSTHAAIMAYESDHSLQLTGAPADALLRMLILGTAGTQGAAEARGRVAKGTPAEQLTRLVQQLLARRGYNIAAIDGRLDEDTRRAILAFEAEQRLRPSGRISAPLVARLQRTGTADRVAAGR